MPSALRFLSFHNPHLHRQFDPSDTVFPYLVSLLQQSLIDLQFLHIQKNLPILSAMAYRARRHIPEGWFAQRKAELILQLSL